jgi:hypothetical protein
VGDTSLSQAIKQRHPFRKSPSQKCLPLQISALSNTSPARGDCCSTAVRFHTRTLPERPRTPGHSRHQHGSCSITQIFVSSLVASAIPASFLALVHDAALQIRARNLNNDVLIAFDQRDPSIFVPIRPTNRLKLDINFEVRAISADVGTPQPGR